MVVKGVRVVIASKARSVVKAKCLAGMKHYCLNNSEDKTLMSLRLHIFVLIAFIVVYVYAFCYSYSSFTGKAFGFNY